MRILHTSDWHLGQHFFGKSRLVEHQAFINWLVQTVEQQQIDVVLVVGDIFDTGTPPSYARELYNQCIVKLQSLQVQLVVLGGNHDSVAMLQESRELLACLNVQVIPGYMANPEDHLIALYDRNGTQQAWLCALPYLRPRDLLQSQSGESLQQKQQQLQQAIQQQYQRIWELAASHTTGLPVVGSGHLTTVGASLSESVRELYIGMLEAFPADAFPPFDYLALGHIHRSQRIAGTEHIRYSGSPIALSFDEARQQKQVLMVELSDQGLQQVVELPVPVFRKLISLRSELDALPAQFAELAVEANEDWPVWVEVVVQADAYLADLQARIEVLTDELPIEVLRVRRERLLSAQGFTRQAKETLSELSPDEVFARRLALEDLPESDAQALMLLHRQLLSELETGELPL